MPRSLLLIVWFMCIPILVHVVQAQNGSGATTHPDEARALNSIFAAWKIQAPREWNISGELCSGVAINENITISTADYNPLIKCECSFVNSTICRITALKVYAIDVVGPIPEELWTLEYLTNLNLAQNFLTGSLSPAIGNLIQMQWMTFGINALSGSIPKEIGLLTDLRSLGLSSNNFSGSLPSEIGKCRKLEQMYIGSSGLSGEIPLSFANLVDMEVAWIMDLELTGQIPEFLGKWTKLTTLRIFGTGMSGPLPLSFSNLTSLTEMRLGDISNVSSSLEFIKDMKSLSILVLRNCNFTGTIPADIGEYSSLQQLDLSFNKLHGPIPASLFDSSQATRLTHLFLGNNMLNGSLPNDVPRVLSNIDVSYNDLSGSLPLWVRSKNLQVNLVANNFTWEGLGYRVLFGLNCLQKNFPCKGSYFDFSINCGGPEIKSVSGVVFEKDEEDLGEASFVVSDSLRWATSNVGVLAGSSNNIYIATSESQLSNTSDSELFQSARFSASSLRYYGLGLLNGGYTITLQFAEIQIPSITSNSWRSLGRRRFDIYIQGRLVEKDFDIWRIAGNSTVRVVQRKYKANVSENYLEIHLFWAGKGTCCIPIQGTYGPLISTVSATPDFTPPLDNKPASKEKSRRVTIVGVIVGIGLLMTIFAGVVIFIIRKRRNQYIDDEELLNMDVKPYTFSYSELKSATQDFDPSKKLGEGGFGPVHKGTLNDGTEVAVKSLSVGSRQGKGQFVAEIVAISAVLHRNLVKLYGCCFEGDHRLLVYEYLPNGSLDQALFGNKTLHLEWSTRYEICLGVARGLVYLHEEARVRIVHRDVKASNILLDSNLVPKVSDFGLAKLYDDKKTHLSTRVAGTIGYLAPEYAMRGLLTEKADVYAFGVLVLELVSGRPNSDVNLEDEKRFLLEWVWNLHENNREVELIDEKLSEINMNEAKRMIGIALLCIQTSHTLRPSMSRVVAMLSGDIEVGEVSSKPGHLTDWRSDDTTKSIFSGLQTNNTSDFSSYSTSFVMPRDNDSKPMLGFQD